MLLVQKVNASAVIPPGREVSCRQTFLGKEDRELFKKNYKPRTTAIT